MNRIAGRAPTAGATLWASAALIPMFLLAGAAGAQYAGDGARQNAAGGWDADWGFCAQGPPAASETVYDCRSHILSAGTNVPGNPYWNPDFDTQIECVAPAATPGGAAEWNAPATCTNNWYWWSKPLCLSRGGLWLTNVCRGRWRWDPEAPAENQANYRDNCTRCHNQRWFTGTWLGLGESYLQTGHKNMLRPVAPLGNDDPHYTTNAPWAGADGAVYAADSSGNPIDFATGTITVGGVPRDLFWIFGGWASATPRAIYEGQTYGCARCHTTGWSAEATMATDKQPYLMFGDYTGRFSTAGDGQPYTSWDQWGIQCSRCHGSRLALGNPDPRHDANLPGKEATGVAATGATRTALCMDCHRQETGGAPWDAANPAGALKVGPYHESVEFLSHWHGNLVLNSPHALFDGTFAQINDKNHYDSYFRYEGEGVPLSGNAGGCTQCHDVHRSTVTAANPDGGAIREECTTCHAKRMEDLLHPTGLDTPVENKLYPNRACVICHMPEGLHLFRVSVDETYRTFPAAALTAPANANATADGAVWVDLDHACGQCHGGGAAHAETTGTIAAGSKALAVADPTDLAAGERIEIAGAGAGGDSFHTYIASIAGATVNLAGKAAAAVTGAAVVQNPVRGTIVYFDRAQLAAYAVGMHADKPDVFFSYHLGSPNTLQLFVDASASTCTGSPANCDAYAWQWGDGTPDGSGLTASHVYAAGGTYPVRLTVTEYGIGSASRTQNVTVATPDLPPAVHGTCSFDANTWIATATDSPPATDDQGIVQYVVNWGDGSIVANDTIPPFGPFTHTYNTPGTFTIARKVVDTIGQQTTDTSCVATPAFFTLSGSARRAAGTPVALVTVTVKRGLAVVRTVFTDALGNFAVPSLRPGTYNLTAKRTGLTFPQSFDVTVGPSSGGWIFQSVE